MSLINPKNSKNPVIKQVTIRLPFETWNALIATGEPVETLERILDGWYKEQLNKKDSYFDSGERRIKSIDFGELTTDENLVILRERLARAAALGQPQKANSIQTKITEIERDLLLKEKLEKEKENS